jgi:hypothetical protein
MVVSGIRVVARARLRISRDVATDSATIYTSGCTSGGCAFRNQLDDCEKYEEDAMRSALIALTLPLVLAFGVAVSAAQDAGQIKVSKGSAQIERSGKKLPANVGQVVQQGDVVVTGADGSVGITFRDSSLVSIGPDSVLAIDRFVFDSTTHQGAFDSSLKQGTLAVVSGKLAKQSPEAMKVKTPAAILGVRGTEFLVRTGPVKD